MNRRAFFGLLAAGAAGPSLAEVGAADDPAIVDARMAVARTATTPLRISTNGATAADLLANRREINIQVILLSDRLKTALRAVEETMSGRAFVLNVGGPETNQIVLALQMYWPDRVRHVLESRTVYESDFMVALMRCSEDMQGRADMMRWILSKDEPEAWTVQTYRADLVLVMARFDMLLANLTLLRLS